MRTFPLLGSVATAIGAAALLAGCGGSATPSGTTSAPSASATASSSALASASAGANAAMTVAVTATDIQSSAASFTQTGDGLLGGTPGTDARVFTSADGKTRIEVDLAVDTSRSAAAADYSAYMSAAQKQVTMETSSSTPAIGSQANEYVGTDTSSSSVVSLSFVQGTVIGVITMVSTSGTVMPSDVEAIATTQVQKISAAAF